MRRLFGFLIVLSLATHSYADGLKNESIPVSTPEWAEQFENALIVPPTAAWANAKVQTWLKNQKATEAQNQAVAAIWEKPAAPVPQELLDRTVKSFAAIDDKTRDLVEGLTFSQELVNVPDPKKLFDIKDIDAFYSSNLRVYLGRYLTHLEMYEEALEVFEKVDIKETVDPAGFLFFMASCQMALGLRPEALITLEVLLTRTPEFAPPRYLSIAQLMKYELGATEEGSLNDVAGKMNDVTRRLKLARAGKKTQKVEEDIVAMLDKIIKQEEDKANSGGGGEGKGGPGKGKASGSSPAQDSQVKGSAAPGEVDKKRTKPGANWGNLPEKERTQVKNVISRDFPAHYRQVIEEYFKKLATRDSK